MPIAVTLQSENVPRKWSPIAPKNFVRVKGVRLNARQIPVTKPNSSLSLLSATQATCAGLRRASQKCLGKLFCGRHPVPNESTIDCDSCHFMQVEAPLSVGFVEKSFKSTRFLVEKQRKWRSAHSVMRKNSRSDEDDIDRGWFSELRRLDRTPG